jgi:hypothetical protein
MSKTWAISSFAPEEGWSLIEAEPLFNAATHRFTSSSAHGWRRLHL